ncbi:hypothetical protein RND71_028363 [Anisodus tanguticus]|uniref:Uncharacterized protein n=1 Tax=Anisodus tanguticus TaxID=243964 RepID=A0AAE1RJN4_9SOLA|nr:hypothetical protein RND71_028363 [Anisodus tanguticus]
MGVSSVELVDWAVLVNPNTQHSITIFFMVYRDQSNHNHICFLSSITHGLDYGSIPAKDKLEKSMVADNKSGKSIKSEVRTSSGISLLPTNPHPPKLFPDHTTELVVSWLIPALVSFGRYGARVMETLSPIPSLSLPKFRPTHLIAVDVSPFRAKHLLLHLLSTATQPNKLGSIPFLFKIPDDTILCFFILIPHVFHPNSRHGGTHGWNNLDPPLKYKNPKSLNL